MDEPIECTVCTYLLGLGRFDAARKGSGRLGAISKTVTSFYSKVSFMKCTLTLL